MAKPALGRGLGALLGGSAQPAKEPISPAPASLSRAPAPAEEAGTHLEEVRRISLTQIRPCPFQPRKDFPPEALRELADSIKEQGIVQPLIVRRRTDFFELIAGERRWRAAQLAGLADAPVIVREANDHQVLELALIENLQRENLNPLEEALGYSQLIEQFRLKQEEVAIKVGKSRATVANALRLLRLPPPVQEHVRAGKLSVGHAKVILGLDPVQQLHAAEKVLKESLSVRQTEELVAQWQAKQAAPAQTQQPATPPRDPHVADVENRLRQHLATKVSVRYQEGKGSIEIRFFNDEDLNRILQLVGISAD